MTHQRPTLRIATIGVLLLVSQAAWAGDPFAGIDAYLAQAMAKWEVPGLAIAVVKGGEVVLAHGYGLREIGTDRPVAADTVFSIASCTKSFTAAAIAMLVDEGKVGWDDAVKLHWPEFEVADAYVTQHATLRDLLCHRTGLVRGDLLSVKGDLSADEILHRTRLLGQAAPFRTKFTYHNVMYGVLGKVIAEKSGMSWEHFVTQRMIEPLGLASTTVTRTSVPADKLATRHRTYDGKVMPLQKPIRDELVAPAGAVHSSVVDMAQWLKLHLREGNHDSHALIKPETVREMHALQHSIPVNPPQGSSPYKTRFVGTGLGWFAREYRGHKVVQHGGAWGAEMAFVPDMDLAVIVLSNLDHNGLVWMLPFDVIDAYLLGPEAAWSKGDKWDFWLLLGGPGHMDRERVTQWKQLDQSRTAGTRPTLPLLAYSGTYESDLYGELEVACTDDRLCVHFGDHCAQLTHWQDDMFSGHAVVEPFLDWLVKFRVEDGQSVPEFEIVHVGWKDPDEKHLFRRVPSRRQ
jgi:CubicO group peptidase (beta-lactamase class C family)